MRKKLGDFHQVSFSFFPVQRNVKKLGIQVAHFVRKAACQTRSLNREWREEVKCEKGGRGLTFDKCHKRVNAASNFSRFSCWAVLLSIPAILRHTSVMTSSSLPYENKFLSISSSMFLEVGRIQSMNTSRGGRSDLTIWRQRGWAGQGPQAPWELQVSLEREDICELMMRTDPNRVSAFPLYSCATKKTSCPPWQISPGRTLKQARPSLCL